MADVLSWRTNNAQDAVGQKCRGGTGYIVLLENGCIATANVSYIIDI